MLQLVEKPEILRDVSPGSDSNGTKANLHVLLATWLGELFDGMDASIYVLVLFPAISELIGSSDHSVVGPAGAIVLAVFMFGWAVGAVVFGMLADRIGRSKTMVITILLYALCTGLCGLAHNWQELSFYRFLVGCGIGGEISIGAVLLSEHWRGKERLHAVGALCSSFGFGYLIAAALNLIIGSLGWRYLFFAGVVPALLTLYVRARVPESAQFQQIRNLRLKVNKDARFGVSAPLHEKVHGFALLKLFSAEFRTKVITVSGLATATIIGYWAILSWIPAWINQLTGSNAIAERSHAAIAMNIGAILASLIGGFVIDRFGRKGTFQICFAGSLLICLSMFLAVKSFGTALLVCVFFAGSFATLPFVVLFAYVPELFPATIRATAFGCAVQVGRIFAAAATLAAGKIISTFDGSYAMAGACLSSIYLIGLAFTCVMPESNGEVETGIADV